MRVDSLHQLVGINLVLTVEEALIILEELKSFTKIEGNFLPAVLAGLGKDIKVQIDTATYNGQLDDESYKRMGGI